MSENDLCGVRMVLFKSGIRRGGLYDGGKVLSRAFRLHAFDRKSLAWLFFTPSRAPLIIQIVETN